MLVQISRENKINAEKQKVQKFENNMRDKFNEDEIIKQTPKPYSNWMR